MRIIIIDPFLSDLSGHNFFYNNSLCSELKRRNLPFVIFGNKDSLLKIENFHPDLESIADKFFSNDNPFSSFIKLCMGIRSLKKRLNNLFFYNQNFNLEEGDILFAHTLYIFELFSFAYFLRKNSRQFINKKCIIRIGLNFRYIRNSVFATFLLKLIYKFICSFLLAELGDRVIYHSDCQLLIPEFERLLDKKIFFSSMPVYPLKLGLASPSVNFKQDILYKDKIILSYIGGARYNKGFDVFIKTLAGLLNRKEILNKIFIIIQADMHKRQQSKRDAEVVCQAMAKLEVLSKNIPNMMIIRGSLSLSDYYSLLLQSALVVLPYRDETYKVATSNIFVETVVAGKIPIVSANTWMAEELSKYGFKGLTFRLDVDDLIKVISSALEQFPRLRDLIKHMQKDYQGLYSSEKLVDLIISNQSQP